MNCVFHAIAGAGLHFQFCDFAIAPRFDNNKLYKEPDSQDHATQLIRRMVDAVAFPDRMWVTVADLGVAGIDEVAKATTYLRQLLTRGIMYCSISSVISE